MTNEIQEIAAGGTPTLSEGVEECWMDLDGARMRYLRAGSGPPLILLHGLLGIFVFLAIRTARAGAVCNGIRA